MIRLLKVELGRLVARRAVLTLLVAMVAAPVAFGILVSLDSPVATPEKRAEAVAMAERDAQSEDIQAELTNCIENPDQWGLADDENLTSSCEEMILPQPEWYGYEYLDLRAEQNDTGVGVFFVVALLAVLAGATFVGHDWNTGSMSNQLLFEPRRLRTWLVKGTVMSIAAGIAGLMGLSAFWLWLASRFWQADVKIDDGLLLDCLQQGWRGAALVGLAAWFGYATTMLTRSTIVTLGLVLAVAVGSGLLSILLVANPGLVDPSINLSAVLQNGVTYEVAESACRDTDDCNSTQTRTLAQGLTYLGGLTLALTLVSVMSFRRRDVP